MRYLLSSLLLCAALGPGLFAVQSSAQTDAAIDQDTGLITAPGWEQVKTTCTACHSSLLILQNSGSREVWHSRIIWMQETQGLQQLDPALEASILDYLAANYGPKAATRRAGLAPELLPPNPYDQ